jgi:hypothetical protein
MERAQQCNLSCLAFDAEQKRNAGIRKAALALKPLYVCRADIEGWIDERLSRRLGLGESAQGPRGLTPINRPLRRGNQRGLPWLRRARFQKPGRSGVDFNEETRRRSTGPILEQSTTMPTLEQEFQAGMINVWETAAQRGYHATYFKQMLDQYGGVQAAKRLLAGANAQSGLFKLYELGLLAYSAEALVIQERFAPLFSQAEIQEARRRLEELHYFHGGQ